MKKHLRSVLTLLLVVMMAFGLVAPVVGYAADSQTLGHASNNEENNITVDSSYDTGWLKIEQLSTPNGIELVVTVTPDLASLKELDKAKVKEIMVAVLGYAKTVVIDQLKDNILGGQQPVSTYSDFGGMEDMLENALDSYITGEGYESGDYLGFFKAALDDVTLIEGLADYACNLLKAAYIGGAVDLETLKGLDVEAAINDAFATTIDEYIEESQTKYVEDYVKYLLGDNSVDISETIRNFADPEVATYIYDFVESVINNTAEVTNSLEQYIYDEVKAVQNDYPGFVKDKLIENKDEIKEDYRTDADLKAELKEELAGDAEFKNKLFDKFLEDLLDHNSTLRADVKVELKDKVYNEVYPEFVEDKKNELAAELGVDVNDPRFIAAWDEYVEASLESEFNTYFEENFDEKFDAYIGDENNHSELSDRFDEYYTDNFDEFFDEKFDEYYDEYFDEYFDRELDNLVDEYVEENPFGIDLIFKDNTTATVIGFIRDLGVEYKPEIVDAVNDKFFNDPTYVSKLYEVVLGYTEAEFNDILADYAVIIADKVDDTIAELEEMGTTGDLSILDMIGYISDVSIGGEIVYSTLDGFNPTAFKNLVFDLPNFYEISQMENGDMQLSYEIVIGTIFGDCAFTITGKVGGGYEYIRDIAGLISRYIDLDVKSDGTIDLDLRIPDEFAKLLLRAAQSGRFSDELKHKIFAAFMADGNDVYALYNNVTFEDLLTLITSIDYEGLLDREFIKHYVDISRLSNEKIDEVIARYEDYFTVLKRYADKVVNKVANRIPDRFMDNDILSVFDHVDSNDAFGYENGTFTYVGTHAVPFGTIVDKGIEKFEQYLPEYVLYVYFIKGLIPDSYYRDYTVTLDVSVHVEHINRVDYVVDGQVIRYGLLPVGADVNFFSDYKNSKLIAWYDQNGRKVTLMPDYDVRLTAILDGKVSTSGDINKVYDGKSETVWVEVGSKNNIYTYEWYDANGNLVTNTNSFKVKDVADSGVYTYYAYVDGVVKHTGTINVNITPCVIDVSDIELDNTLIDHDGKSHTVNLVGVPSGVTVENLTGNVATDAGKHTVTATLSIADGNYKLSANQISLDWYIKYVIDLDQYQWLYPVDEAGNMLYPLTYTGTDIELVLDGPHIDLLEIVYNGNVGKNVGKYTAEIESVSIINTDVAYTVGALNAKTLTHKWEIKPLTIRVPDYEWKPETHVYNGNVQSVEIVIPENYKNDISVTYVTTDAEGNVVEPINVGTYKTVATLTSASENVTLNNGVDNTGVVTVEHEWAITPLEIDVNTFDWIVENYVYDGNAHNATLDIPAEWAGIIEVVYDSFIDTNVKSGVAKYVTTATLTCDANHTLTSYTLTSGEWEITPLELDVSVLEWILSNFTYDGNAHNATLNIPTEWADIIAVVYDSFTDANAQSGVAKYVTTATLTCDLNYTLSAYELVSGEWEITPKVVDISDVQWDYLDSYTYNKAEQSVVLDLTTLPEGVKVVEYLSNTYANAGTYTAKVVLAAINNNYELTGEAPVCEWTINKALLDASSLKLQSTTFNYDGALHNLVVTGDAEVLKMLDIAYTGNGQKLIGVYTVTAKLTLKSEYAVNYIYEGTLTGEITITGEPKVNHEVKDGDDVIIKVEVEGGLDADNFINGSIVNVDGVYEIDGKEVEILVAYDIHFTEDGKLINLNGKKFTVSLLIPEEHRGYDDDEYRVIYIKADGTIEVMTATRNGDYMTFVTDHFSIYAIARVDNTNLVWLWILIAVLLVGGAAAVVIIMIKKKKEEENAPSPDEIPEVEAEPTEETEEAPAEEVVEEETTEEAEEEPAVEEVVEETEEEIPAVEEEVVEEEAEEVPAEEEAPVEEEPVAEEEPAAEEQPKSAVLVMSESGKDATAVIGGETVHIRFRSSLMSRLIQSSENVQSYYTTIKNYLLSFKGVKARGSWNYEAFNKGRIQCAKLNVKGKTLLINLNLNPADFNVNKYHFVDVSDKPKFAKVPMMMKVRSERAVKYTLELIDEMMKLFGIPQLEIPTVDYRMPYETTEQLAMRGLVKVILPAGVTLSDDLTFVHMNVTELIESGTTEKTTEQIIGNEDEANVETAIENNEIEEIVVVVEPVEETVVEEPEVEEPVVEETVVEEPVVEETVVEEPVVEEPEVEETVVEEPVVEEPVVEETVVEETVVEETVVEETVVEEPVVEETVVEEGIHHVDADTADQLISDEEAESSIEIVHTGANSRSGKMGEINLDVICENYDNDDIVNVDTLKEKRLISNKIARVKVLARGVMTKRLTVVASKFSLQAVKMITLAGGKAELED